MPVLVRAPEFVNVGEDPSPVLVVKVVECAFVVVSLLVDFYKMSVKRCIDCDDGRTGRMLEKDCE